MIKYSRMPATKIFELNLILWTDENGSEYRVVTNNHLKRLPADYNLFKKHGITLYDEVEYLGKVMISPGEWSDDTMDYFYEVAKNQGWTPKEMREKK